MKTDQSELQIFKNKFP